MLLAAVSIAFMARRFSTDIVRWGTQKLQPGRKKVRQLPAKQVNSAKLLPTDTQAAQPPQDARALHHCCSLHALLRCKHVKQSLSRWHASAA